MPMYPVAGISLYRPSDRAELALRDEIIAHLGAEGIETDFYTGKDANRVVQCIYGRCSTVFDQAIEECGSRRLAEFLLEQLNAWTDAGQMLNNAELPPEEADFVQKHLANSRLAAMLAMEAMVVAGPPQLPKSTEAMGWLNLGFAAAEIMITMAMYSTSAHAVLPDHTEVTVDLSTPSNYLDMRLAEPYRSRWVELQRRRLLARQDSMDLLEPGPTDAVLDHLDPVFKETFGWSMREAFGVVDSMMTSYHNSHEGFDVAFVRQAKVYEAVANNVGIPETDVRAVLDAITLKPSMLSAEPRELWRPGQSSRALRRPVLLLPHPTEGLHLCWKNAVVKASGVYLLQEMCFRKLPPEWRTPATTQAVDAISQKLDGDWEKTIHSHLIDCDLVGDLNVLNVRSQDGEILRLDDGDRPGEIDGLYWNKATLELYVLEFKRTQPTFSPSQFRADISKYSSGKKPYCLRHKRKVEWVRSNLHRVLEHLTVGGHIDGTPDPDEITVKGCIITKYECFVQVLDTPFPVLSLATVLREFRSGGTWPFAAASTGVN